MPINDVPTKEHITAVVAEMLDERPSDAVRLSDVAKRADVAGKGAKKSRGGK